MKNCNNNNGCNRRCKVLSYFCVFLLLVICSIACFIVFSHLNEVLVDLKDKPTMLFMTVLGFLFAFAGINIYSIFNTNIDEEKYQLRKLQKEYERELIFTKSQWDYSKKLIKYYQFCQMLIDSKKFNYQVFSWIDSLKKCIEDFSNYLSILQDDYREQQFNSFKTDFTDISRGIRIQIESFLTRIQAPTSTFFTGYSAERSDCITRLDEIIGLIDNLERTNYQSREFSVDPKKQTFSERFHMLSAAIKNLFCPHRDQ